MAAIFLSPVYLAVNLYVAWRMLLWMRTCSSVFQNPVFQGIFIGIYVIFATSVLTGFLIKKPVRLRRCLKNIGNYFLGIFLYVLMPVFFLEILGIIGRVFLQWTWVGEKDTLMVGGSLCAALVAGVSLYGVYNARRIRVTPYQIRLEKEIPGKKSLTIVLAADLHLGYNSGERQVKKMVDQINRQNPDLVCIAGDIFDNEFEAVKNPEKIQKTLRQIKASYGVYACWGNHDISEPILAGFTFAGAQGRQLQDERMEQFVKKAGITILNDEIRLIKGSFYLAGRKDLERAKKIEGGRKSAQELLAGADREKPIFVMDHQPKELAELAKAGADLDLCGHTHGGQLFPGNFAIELGWENAYGCLKKDEMYNIVTSGTGIWGPNMRIGTKSEICVIHVECGGRARASCGCEKNVLQ